MDVKLYERDEFDNKRIFRHVNMYEYIWSILSFNINFQHVQGHILFAYLIKLFYIYNKTKSIKYELVTYSIIYHNIRICI